ncbi:MAG: energy transducer TonB [Bacteroidales bacterium]|nr:energy transducer TonB [Bacteroidales bacterium]MBN2763699.1 energy transducer TonB [Bacteroidales bacterium]
MTEKSKIQDLFTPSGCLSRQGLKRYIEGGLDPEEHKMADMHIKDCALCADAISGYRHHAQPDEVMSEIHNLNRQLHQRFLTLAMNKKKKREERSMVSVFAVAATIILIAGISLLLRQREMVTEKSLAEAGHDSVLIPVTHAVQPALQKEIEDPVEESKKAEPVKEIKQKTSASVHVALNNKERKTDVADIPVTAAEEVIQVDEADIQLADEAEETVPLIVTDSVTIHGYLTEINTRLMSGDKHSPAAKKSTTVRPETVSAGQVAMKSAEPSDMIDMKSEEAPEEEMFYVVEEMPRFMEGDISRFLQYICENLDYPAKAAEAGIEGRVMVNFVVDENGKPTEIKIIRPVDPLLDAEALRVIASSPLWKPGRQRGEPVKVSYTIPIVFSLQE